MLSGLRDRGVQAALLSAVLFGAGTPAAKLLLDSVSPWLLAGLLYTGSGIGLGLFRLIRRSPRVRLPRGEYLPLGGAILFGGILGPVLLLVGLVSMPASGASLLLNAEGVFTAVLAWFVFKENFDRRIALGMLAIVAGAVVLSIPTGADLGTVWPSLAVLGACLCWGIDNNLTRKVALNDATWLAAVKGGVAGPVNLILAFALGAQLPAVSNIAAAMVVGFFAYGVSLVLFIIALRHVGTARAGAYYSVAPFFGAILALVLGESPTVPLIIAGALMAVGLWLHLTERHEHEHTHEPVTHDHWHVHDEHHQHEHPDGMVVKAGRGHKHEHTHEAITHTHEHYPDSHHRHSHPPTSPGASTQ
jgi:drug/metabolite transporter (DMT)-like permease